MHGERPLLFSEKSSDSGVRISATSPSYNLSTNHLVDQPYFFPFLPRSSISSKSRPESCWLEFHDSKCLALAMLRPTRFLPTNFPSIWCHAHSLHHKNPIAEFNSQFLEVRILCVIHRRNKDPCRHLVWNKDSPCGTLMRNISRPKNTPLDARKVDCISWPQSQGDPEWRVSGARICRLNGGWNGS